MARVVRVVQTDTTADVRVIEGIDDKHVDAALRVAYDAFAVKFRIGFRNPDDLIRLFQDSVDTTSCLSATVDGHFAGFLAFQTSGREFYHLNPLAVLTRFSPLRAIRVLFNLVLLAGGAGPYEFIVDSLAVDRSSRGMGVGTALMQRAEEMAGSVGKRTMSLGVIGENEGAIRLYERLGYKTTRIWRGFLVRLASGSTEVRRMEKPLVHERPSAGPVDTQ